MRRALRLAAFFLAFAGAREAAAQSSCPPWRPCGPGYTWGGNRLIRQGIRDVDLRPACAQHDACLEAGCSPRYCDRQFRDNLYSACAYSANPAACRRKAKRYFLATRIAHMFEG